LKDHRPFRHDENEIGDKGHESMKTLDVGCGVKKREGATGIDRLAIPGVDIVWNLDEYPWPVEDSSFDRIVMSHVIEHLVDPSAALKEVHRIAAPGAEVEIITPHFSSLSSWKDPTHRHHFALETFDFFVGPEYGTGRDARFELIDRRLSFRGGLTAAVARVFAFFSLTAYERTAAFRFPARNIFVRLRAVK